MGPINRVVQNDLLRAGTGGTPPNQGNAPR
jgi:hypothetical protein